MGFIVFDETTGGASKETIFFLLYPFPIIT
jgi:hypothetical protein